MLPLFHYPRGPRGWKWFSSLWLGFPGRVSASHLPERRDVFFETLQLKALEEQNRSILSSWSLPSVPPQREDRVAVMSLARESKVFIWFGYWSEASPLAGYQSVLLKMLIFPIRDRNHLRLPSSTAGIVCIHATSLPWQRRSSSSLIKQGGGGSPMRGNLVRLMWGGLCWL